MKLILLGFIFLLLQSALAMEFHDVKMQESLKINDHDLILNGMALRKVKRFGIYWKIYVAGLYLTTKSQDGESIINSNDVKKVVMEYKRGIQRGKIIDGWKKGFKVACRVDCEKWHDQYEVFIEAVTDSKKGSQMILTIYPDKVLVENIGTSKDKMFEFKSNALGKNLMSIFLDSKNPPSQRFRSEMLGLSKKKS